MGGAEGFYSGVVLVEVQDVPVGQALGVAASRCQQAEHLLVGDALALDVNTVAAACVYPNSGCVPQA